MGLKQYHERRRKRSQTIHEKQQERKQEQNIDSLKYIGREISSTKDSVDTMSFLLFISLILNAYILYKVL